jgi:hypothetical protein
MYKLPESDDKAFCYAVNGRITRQAYDSSFVPGLEEIRQKRGAVYMVVYFYNYEGWDESAMISDLETHLEYGRHVKRIAFVNAPEKFKLKMKLMDEHTAGEVRYFDEDDYDSAVSWVKTGNTGEDTNNAQTA